MPARGSSKSSRSRTCTAACSVPASRRPSDPDVHAAPAFSSHFSTVAPNYDVLLCDVWGVVHNGVAATANACEALRQFRAQGGTVILITNAPRPGDFVQRFIDRLKVPRESYDAIVSSGDVTRALIARTGGRAGRPHRPGARPADLRRSRRVSSCRSRAPTTWSAPACSTTRRKRRTTTTTSSRRCARASCR